MSDTFIPDLHMQMIMPDDWFNDAYGKSLKNHLVTSLGVPQTVFAGDPGGASYSSCVTAMESFKAMMDAIPKPDPMSLNGNMFVDRFLCESPRFIRWKRKHRKARINKKWQKRYGAVYETCKGVAFNVLGNLHVCPCMAKAMKELKP